jgi:prolyl 4-hydroxylase
MISSDDPVSVCLSSRLKSILGNVQHIDTEDLQVVKYEGTETFRAHMDWFNAPRDRTHDDTQPRRPYNRLASVFAYLDDNCTGGETFFPRVQGVSSKADGEKFSRTDSGTGLLVRPRRGNAVLWINLFQNGTGDPRVAHTGLPPLTGQKIGMNLFSYYYLDAPFIGDAVESSNFVA